MKFWGPRVLRLDGMSWLINDGQCESRHYSLLREIPLNTGANAGQSLITTTTTRRNYYWECGEPMRHWIRISRRTVSQNCQHPNECGICISPLRSGKSQNTGPSPRHWRRMPANVTGETSHASTLCSHSVYSLQRRCSTRTTLTISSESHPRGSKRHS